MTVVAVSLVGLGLTSPPASADGYPFDCPKQQVLVVHYDDGSVQTFTTVQAAVTEANGDPTQSSVGDTVIVCPGTYQENVSVPPADTTDPNHPNATTNDNITIRAWDDEGEHTVIQAADPSQPVISVQANGVTVGGPGLGLTITGGTTGIQVGMGPLEPTQNPPPGMEEPDDQPSQGPVDVTVVGNRVVNLTGAGPVTGILVDNTNNTLVYRNLIDGDTATSGSAYGIRFTATNSHAQVLGNAVRDLSAPAADCSSATLAAPSGAVGVSVEDEALDALVHRTLVEKVSTNCAAIGIYSSAWGTLENERTGRLVPIVTDVVDNRVKSLEGAASIGSGSTASPGAAGVVLAPNPIPSSMHQQMNNEDNPPSAFRVMANDLDDQTPVAVAVVMQMAAYSYIRENDFGHHQIGVLNLGNNNLDATNNFWGCDEGPGGKPDCATTVGDVYSMPFLKHHVDHAGEHAGEWAGHD